MNNQFRWENFFPALFIPFIFFVVCLLTLSHYGISWDEPIHFQRGQGYLYYFLTGETTYKNLPLKQNFHYFITGETTYKNLLLNTEYLPKLEGVDLNRSYEYKKVIPTQAEGRRSYFQNESLNGEYFINGDSGHPPLNGILAALINKILYQDLGIMGDIESHHLFIVVSATILVAVVSIFAYQTYGFVASIVAGVSLSLYPLFFSESHFNIKDPPEAAFFGLTIWSFWMSLNKKSWKLLLVSILGFSLALGTKFNILFLPIIILPYLLIRYLKNIRKFPRSKSYLIVLFLSPIIVAVIFFGTWPYLWQDLWDNTLKIFKFYKDIGTLVIYQPEYILPGGFNIYPLYWITITTPVWMLVLSIVGIFAAFKNAKKQNYVSILWLLWFLIPIIRISIPGTSVYGGIRQIMEYVPAMALLSGLGAHFLVTRFKVTSNKFLKTSFILVTCYLLLLPVIRYHPNENVYFNLLVGGLSGAHQKQIPSNGNSFGNAYYQAVKWINKNVEQGAKVSLLQGTLTNIPTIYLRQDIKLWNSFWSAINREGEYIVELTYQGSQVAYPYAWSYVENFLEPVYEVKVDNVPIAKIWKNDFEHTRPKYRLLEKPFTGKINLEVNNSEVIASLSEEVAMSHITLNFNKNEKCTLHLANVAISNNKVEWVGKIEDLLSQQINAQIALDGETANYYFPGDRAKYIRIRTNDENSCLLNIKSFSATILQ